ncbi:MAG: VOC family protein [Candidatus Flexifilum sp.]|jgi:catechol 2,3-dioxygenase-like lactoylglutathione lyase family enzyme
MPAFNRLTVNLMTEDVKATCAFYTDVLGFTIHGEVPDRLDPTINQFAVLGRDQVTIMVQSRRSMGEDAPPLSGVPIGASMTLFINVDDVEALAAGLAGRVEIVNPLHDTWYDTREIHFKDVNGYVLCLAQQLAPAQAADGSPSA